jgi:adenosylmethionine-8-amino-7-oxononanoate aminotransferase
MADGNVTTTTKPKSALQTLVESLKDAKKPSASDIKAVTNSFIKAMGEREKLQKALDDFDAKANKTAEDMVRCFGAEPVRLGGMKYVPTSRGSRIYYKKMSDHAINLDE